jgi:hypothetical protein
MEYKKLMLEVEKIFKNQLDKYISKKYGSNDKIGHQLTIDVTYTEIRALGYSFGNVEDALKETQKSYSNNLGHHFYKGLLLTSKSYKAYVKKFSQFHLEYINGLQSEKLIENLNNSFNL